MQNIHPLFVHFPVALILASFALDCLAVALKRPNLHIAARMNLTFGFLSALAAVATGLLAEKLVEHSGAVHELMETHKKIGLTILILSGILTLWRWVFRSAGFVKKATAIYLALSFVLCALILFSSYCGGRMVYEYGVGVTTPAAAPAEHLHHHHEH